MRFTWKRSPLLDPVVAAPRAVHLAVREALGAAGGLELRDQRADRLRLVLARHHHRVGGLDHHHVLEADAGEQAVLRDEQRVPRVGGVHVAVDHVAVGVLVLDLPQRVPGADVGPAGIERHHHRVVGVSSITA